MLSPTLGVAAVSAAFCKVGKEVEGFPPAAALGLDEDPILLALLAVPEMEDTISIARCKIVLSPSDNPRC